MHGTGGVDGWEDIPDVVIPIMYIKWVMTIMNELEGGDTYSATAFDQLKEFILNIYPYIARNPTVAELERTERLMQIPSFLGGLGY